MLELLLLAAGLAMDAAAVSAATALSHPNAHPTKGALMAATFGAFQAGMPCIGWFLGAKLAGVASRYTPWIAFAILVVLGAKMIRTAVRGEEPPESQRPNPFTFRSLVALGVATSLDALAVGVTLPLLGLRLVVCASVIGLVTFVLAAAAFQLGKFLGDRVGKRLEVAGGIALVGVGVKLLLDHVLGG